MNQPKINDEKSKTEILREGIINNIIITEPDSFLSCIKENEDLVILSFSERFREFVSDHREEINLEFSNNNKNPDYSDIVTLKRAINRKLKKKNLSVNDLTLKKWLKDENNPQGCTQSRENIFRLCFCFELTTESADEFFNKVFFLPSFNFRDMKETVYYYFLKNKKSYNEAISFLNKVQSSSDSVISSDKSTNQIFIEVNKFPDIIDDFTKYIIKEKSNFIMYSRRLDENMGILLNRALEENLDDKTIENKQLKISELLRRIFDNYIPINNDTSDTYKKNIFKTHKFDRSIIPAQIRKNLPIELTVDKMYTYFCVDKNKYKRPSQDSIRKHMIMLCFYIIFRENELEAEYKDFEVFTNDCLTNSGLSPLYWRNPYDCMFMYSATQRGYNYTPIVALQSVYGEISNPYDN